MSALRVVVWIYMSVAILGKTGSYEAAYMALSMGAFLIFLPNTVHEPQARQKTPDESPL